MIGREGADLTIADDEVSRRHTLVRPVERGVVVEDLGSTNGTFVNGEQISEAGDAHARLDAAAGELGIEVELDLGAPTKVREVVPAGEPTVAREVPRPSRPSPNRSQRPSPSRPPSRRPLPSRRRPEATAGRPTRTCSAAALRRRLGFRPLATGARADRRRPGRRRGARGRARPGRLVSAVNPDSFSERFPGLARSMDPAELEALLDALEVHDADAGEALVAQGTPSSDLFLVWEGRLDITMRSAAAERKLAALEPGSYFGEVSLLDPGPAGASVVTEQGCVVLRLDRERFDELQREHPQSAAALLHQVVRSLSNRLAAASGQPAQSAPDSLQEEMSLTASSSRESSAQSPRRPASAWPSGPRRSLANTTSRSSGPGRTPSPTRPGSSRTGPRRASRWSRSGRRPGSRSARARSVPSSGRGCRSASRCRCSAASSTTSSASTSGGRARTPTTSTRTWTRSSRRPTRSSGACSRR